MDLLIYIVRCIIMFIVTYAALRIIGKKSIAQMTSYELGGLLLLITVAAEPLVTKVSSKTVVGIFTLSFCIVVLGLLSLNKKFYNVDSKPAILISKGYINIAALRKNRMNIGLLLSYIRIKGYSKISDVEYAILEPDGDISVFPKSYARPIKPTDMNIQTTNEGITVPVIIDGTMETNNLIAINKDLEWLKGELNKLNIKSINEVLYAELDSQNNLHVETFKQSKENSIKI